jgi:hypothetical protein
MCDRRVLEREAAVLVLLSVGIYGMYRSELESDVMIHVSSFVTIRSGFDYIS